MHNAGLCVWFSYKYRIMITHFHLRKTSGMLIYPQHSGIQTLTFPSDGRLQRGFTGDDGGRFALLRAFLLHLSFINSELLSNCAIHDINKNFPICMQRHVALNEL
jgi:hypothetical protein